MIFLVAQRLEALPLLGEVEGLNPSWKMTKRNPKEFLTAIYMWLNIKKRNSKKAHTATKKDWFSNPYKRALKKSLTASDFLKSGGRNSTMTLEKDPNSNLKKNI